MEPIIIGIDTGNRCIKTKNTVFVAGIKTSETAPITSRDVIQWNGKYWALTNERIAYMRDKTESDSYFVLTLFGIIKELQNCGITLRKDTPVPIILGVGLPPSHLAGLKDKFIRYFNRGVVSFRYGNQPISIRIEDVRLFAQGYAAIIGLPPEVRKAPHAYIVDIGGYTTDVMALEHGALDPRFCNSYDMGVIGMYNIIQSKINSATGHMPTEDMIDEILAGSPTVRANDDMKRIAAQEADEYVANMIRKLNEMSVDLMLNQGIFVGGGSARLRSRIEKCPSVKDPYFADNIHANAAGYESFIRAYLRKQA